MAGTWNAIPGGHSLGRYFCEEYTHSLVNAYTEGKGQTNLSDILVNECDNHCRFSVYLRPANMDPAQKKRCYGRGNLYTNKGNDIAAFRKNVGSMFIKLYCYLLKTADEICGSDGVRAVAAGIRKYKSDAVLMIYEKAEHTGNVVDRSFIGLNFPLELDDADEPVWSAYADCHAKEIFDINLLMPIKDELGL